MLQANAQWVERVASQFGAAVASLPAYGKQKPASIFLMLLLLVFDAEGQNYRTKWSALSMSFIIVYDLDDPLLNFTFAIACWTCPLVTFDGDNTTTQAVAA